jgi:hypothetical protein
VAFFEDDRFAKVKSAYSGTGGFSFYAIRSMTSRICAIERVERTAGNPE